MSATLKLIRMQTPVLLCRKTVAGVFLLMLALVSMAQTNNPGTLIEAAGEVEYLSNTTTNWLGAKVGLKLFPGDRLRTKQQSRAALQLSDRSIVRLDEYTTLEILPPRNTEKKRFGLTRGSLYFFNREKPSDVEFNTPLAAGAIRGTEFLLEVTGASDTLHLALIDGLVTLKSEDEEIQLKRGEDLLLESGKPARKTALVNATAKIQWALYYPVVIEPDDLQWSASETNILSKVLANYRSGDLLHSLEAWPSGFKPGSEGVKILRAQLELAVGRVDKAERMLTGLSENSPATALRELIAVVRNENPSLTNTPQTASAQLAHSYWLQAKADLHGARAAAAKAVKLAPESGFAHARLAELEFAFGDRRPALAEMKTALKLSPKLASAQALKGFILLDGGEPKSALSAFEQARDTDAALGEAWLGRGLCLLRMRQFTGARESFQAAAALEPQRSLFRSYLGKAAGELGDAKGATKEFRLAKELDANDPTAWLYSALALWQENKLNAAIRDLETSSDKNDNRAAFRSRELLDGDRSVRSANLAAIYDDAGLTEVSRHVAARSVDESYLNFSGHLFLANSYQAQEDANRFDLRFETARQSELLVANLLAPPGAGNLSQVLSQQERLRYFDEKPLGASSLTSYGSRGDWSETATVFGSQNGFSYAFDAVYQSLNGQRPNNDSEQKDFVFTAKQRITPDDEAYLQVGTFRSTSGDTTSLYDPATASVGLRANEKQEPDVSLGWHHTWSPGIQTLFLASRLDDTFNYLNPQDNNQIFLIQFLGNIIGVQSPPVGPPITNDFHSRTKLYSAELQQIFESEHHSLIVGGRLQSGDVTENDELSQLVQGDLNRQNGKGTFSRSSTYAYYTWRPVHAFSLTGGGAYDHLQFPEDTDFTPFSLNRATRDKFSPKVGLLFAPWNRGLFRAGYTRSIGGLFFDNSVRLEPTQVGGFNQAFRSLIPESVAGLLPGAEFETVSVGFDQSFPSGTFFGVEAGWLTSKGGRTVGVLRNSTSIPFIDSIGSTKENLAFRERNLSLYAAQLLGDYVSASTGYRLSEASLNAEFPGIPASASGLEQLRQQNRALLHRTSLALNLNHPSGLFAQWESTWYHQDNGGYTPERPTSDFWQHNLVAGYRFPNRHAELRAGLLNVTDTDYRLNPLNLHAELPRARTFVASLRLNF